MAREKIQSGTKIAQRRAKGFSRAGNLIDDQLRTISAKRGFQEARLRALWTEIAGPEGAAICQPVKLVLSRGPAGGHLTLAVAGARGPEVHMMIPALRDRVNAALGPGTVGRIQLTQGAPGFAEAQTAFHPPAPPEAPPDITGIGEDLSSIGDDDLRRALETLARNVLSRRRKMQVTDMKP